MKFKFIAFQKKNISLYNKNMEYLIYKFEILNFKTVN